MEATTRTTSCAMSYGWGMGFLQFRLTPMSVSIEQRPWTTKEGQLQKNSVNTSGPISRTDFALRLRVSAVPAQSGRVRELTGPTKPPQVTRIGKQRRYRAPYCSIMQVFSSKCFHGRTRIEPDTPQHLMPREPDKNAHNRDLARKANGQHRLQYEIGAANVL